MPEEKSELQKLFKSNEEPFVGEAPAPEQQEEEVPEDLKNRHIRRLEAKLQSEREASIAREARLQALSEAQKFREESNADDLDGMVSRIWGNEKPENAAATELLQKALKGYSERAKKEALEEFRKEFQERQEEEDREANTVNDYIEQIEDRYGVDLTSTASARERQQELRDLWYRLSPKDKDGEVLEYADPFEVYELFSNSQGDNRAKSLASRGMVRSQPVQNTVQEDATVKYLRENGILDPWN